MRIQLWWGQGFWHLLADGQHYNLKSVRFEVPVYTDIRTATKQIDQQLPTAWMEAEGELKIDSERHAVIVASG